MHVASHDLFNMKLRTCLDTGMKSGAGLKSCGLHNTFNSHGPQGSNTYYSSFVLKGIHQKDFFGNYTFLIHGYLPYRE